MPRSLTLVRLSPFKGDNSRSSAEGVGGSTERSSYRGAYLFSGADGSELRRFASPNIQFEGFFGRAVSGVPDVDGDGRPDLIVGADSENPDGRVYVFSGAAVDLTAVSLSPATLSPGDTFRFRFAVENQTGETLRGAVRAEVRDADGKVLLEPMTISTATLGSTDTLAVEAEQRVPRATAAGLYRYVLTAESNAGVLADVETLEITVTGGTSPSASAAWPRPTVSALADGAVVAVPKVAASAEAAVGVEAFPNPFSSRTTLRFSLDGATEARLAVYDVLGREVAVLHDGYAEAGIHDAVFEADGLATGMYVWRLVAGSRVETGSLTLVR